MRLVYFFLCYKFSICGEIRLERFTVSRTFDASNPTHYYNETNHIRRKRSLHMNSPARNISLILNSLLENYDKNLHPNFAKRTPTNVIINIFVRTMGPISELTDTYSFDCYFRQNWRDERLMYNSSGRYTKELILGMSMLDKIWKPDTYFWNGAGSYVHDLTSMNRLVRLYEDGTVLYSSRLTVKARCTMNRFMHRFPLDRQACRLIVGSYAYGVNDMMVYWKEKNGSIADAVQIDFAAVTELPQFAVTGVEVVNSTTMMRDIDYSALEVRFYFDRHFGYFLMNFYVPCTLIVLLCWVAFWINREATGDRIGLGITSVLTMTFISIDSKSDTPKVDFPTALDVYIWICFAFLGLCVLEFTIVHYFTKFNTGDPEIQQLERERMRQIIRSIPKHAVLSSRYNTRPGLASASAKMRDSVVSERVLRKRSEIAAPSGRSAISRKDGGRFSMYGRRRSTMVRKKTLSQQSSDSLEKKESAASQHYEDMEHFHRDNVGWRLYHWVIDNEHNKTDPFGLKENSSSTVDRFARVAMPVVFMAVVLLYYQFYVNSPFDFDFSQLYKPIRP